MTLCLITQLLLNRPMLARHCSRLLPILIQDYRYNKHASKHRVHPPAALLIQNRSHIEVKDIIVLLDFLVTVKAAPHECVIRTGKP